MTPGFVIFINCIHETLPPFLLHDIILEDSMIAFQ